MEHNLKNYCGVGIEDNHGLTNLYEVIDELEQFINQFSTHAMSDERLVLSRHGTGHMICI